MVEVFDCIIDIGRNTKQYGVCWDLYNRFRQHLSINIIFI